ncbi:hypothetical protein MicloDRAFT_00049350 [Microvirga lotononidis]|uniref:Uncharacterized protein n=1 Tax=Microvirga lotononidis TaxID=864069 RepID=I4YWL0_9HYPH|nr:hypothetical protein MicloDRAFT_00049350 [Microvirga lotononidis]
MRYFVSVSAILLAGFVLSGCAGSAAPMGVLPRDPVPPPPSVSGGALRPSAAAPQSGPTSQRRALSVPGQASTPRP